ncbi:superoxide dismutase [Burkholderia cepacia]|uniref:superoxide dismutase n=1 Tax=Burkholderia cepacia TaxID=292 RepID=UPI000F5F6C6C|nr:Fe-Mn family superoxide dismutase [Burkholderia cepacia]RQT23670.1 superoxide dismutase [Burkholderia cepacia]
MTYQMKALPCDPTGLPGLSEWLIRSHYENNYGGAVKRLNAITEQLAAIDPASARVFVLNGLKREELIAANSMILHEIYFDSLGTGDPIGGALGHAIERDFGSVDRWRAEFVSMGKALGGGSGWVLLTWSPRLGRLMNQWASDHAHTLADGAPLLALDMYEHAYHIDFGAKAGAYVDAFMQNIDWSRVATRFATAAPERQVVQ